MGQASGKPVSVEPLKPAPPEPVNPAPPNVRPDDIKTPIDLVLGPCVTVKVGKHPVAESFIVHKALIRHHSPFFSAALSGAKWPEGDTGVVKLPEDRPDMFRTYTAWLYRMPIIDTIIPGTPSEEFTHAQTAHALYYLIDAYIFGDKILDNDFCDMVIDTLMSQCEKSNKYPVLGVERICNISALDAPQRTLVTDIVISRGSPAWFTLEGVYRSMDAKYFLDIISGLLASPASVGASRLRENWPWVKDPCVYHRHKQTQKSCYRTRFGWAGIYAE